MDPTTAGNHQMKDTTFRHAVVIGSSIAGLTAARVLVDHFAQVTLVDRDRLPETPEFRRGVPQARHAHNLPLRGQRILEAQFPGLVDELLARGALSIDVRSEMAVFLAGEWHELRHKTKDFPDICCSRPLLETTIYRRLMAHPRVEIIQESEAMDLVANRSGERVTGLHLRRRGDAQRRETMLGADLVVDTSGRGSKAAQWLADLGFQPPRETIVNAFAGYASRLYRRPAGFAENWKIMFIKPSPPDRTRGAIVVPIEGERWYVTLLGMARDYPPTDETGYLDFARSLPTPRLYDLIKNAEPLTQPFGFRRTENRVRHYDQLPRYLEGFVVCGDAVYGLNPVYTQGMTAAALGSQALGRALQTQRRHKGTGELAGLASLFQQELTKAVSGPWKMATREDQRWPVTEVTDGMAAVRQRMTRRVATPQPGSDGANRVVTDVFRVRRHRAVAR
jgi:2-polyprenyl-6-methoxyphenol hydroxylase-like FAD-dependent oxidoreductase